MIAALVVTVTVLSYLTLTLVVARATLARWRAGKHPFTFLNPSDVNDDDEVVIALYALAIGFCWWDHVPYRVLVSLVLRPKLVGAQRRTSHVSQVDYWLLQRVSSSPGSREREVAEDMLDYLRERES